MGRTIGTLSITHSCDCNSCGWTAEGNTVKEMYFWLLIHLRFFCKKLPKERKPKFLVTLWQLWRWKPGKKTK